MTPGASGTYLSRYRSVALPAALGFIFGFWLPARSDILTLTWLTGSAVGVPSGGGLRGPPLFVSVE